MNHEDLSALPVEHGFRLRGLATTRTEAFTDAAMAFALTLLVISTGALPGSMEELMLALRRIPAFAASFAILTMFWCAHNRWSRRYGLDDTRSRLLSLGLVFTVLVFVYPLRLVFASFFAAVSGGWFPAELKLRGSGDLQSVFAVYSVAYMALSAVILMLHTHALRCAESLRLDALEIYDTRTVIGAWRIQVGTAAVSLAVALLHSPSQSSPFLAHGVPGMVYGTLGITMWIWEARRARARAGLLAGRAGSGSAAT